MPAARRQRTGTLDQHGQFRMNEMRGRPNVEPLPENYTGEQPVKVAPERGAQMVFNAPKPQKVSAPRPKRKKRAK